MEQLPDALWGSPHSSLGNSRLDLEEFPKIIYISVSAVKGDGLNDTGSSFQSSVPNIWKQSEET